MTGDETFAVDRLLATRAGQVERFDGEVQARLAREGVVARVEVSEGLDEHGHIRPACEAVK
jgi:hypothetical protein